jgi:hypothetical protein
MFGFSAISCVNTADTPGCFIFRHPNPESGDKPYLLNPVLSKRLASLLSKMNL